MNLFFPSFVELLIWMPSLTLTWNNKILFIHSGIIHFDVLKSIFGWIEGGTQIGYSNDRIRQIIWLKWFCISVINVYSASLVILSICLVSLSSTTRYVYHLIDVVVNENCKIELVIPFTELILIKVLIMYSMNQITSFCDPCVWNVS